MKRAVLKIFYKWRFLQNTGYILYIYGKHKNIWRWRTILLIQFSYWCRITIIKLTWFKSKSTFRVKRVEFFLSCHFVSSNLECSRSEILVHHVIHSRGYNYRSVHGEMRQTIWSKIDMSTFILLLPKYILGDKFVLFLLIF